LLDPAPHSDAKSPANLGLFSVSLTERPRIKTEISQKKHGQREQKFLPIMFHGQDIQ
jgi:hypothetical protein